MILICKPPEHPKQQSRPKENAKRRELNLPLRKRCEAQLLAAGGCF